MNFLKTAVFPYLKRHSLILALAAKRFYKGSRLLWAASLTFTTVFSLVPLLSVLFYLFNAFGALSDLKTVIQPYVYRSLAPGAQERVLNIIDTLVNGVDFATIGAMGSSVLVISIFLLLFEIEYALNEIWEFYQSKLTKAGLEWLAFGHIGNNHVHINIMPRSREEMQAGLTVYHEFAKKAVALGGTVSAEHGIGKIKKGFLPLMFSAPELEEMKGVKRSLDPGLILNPGNVFDM